MSFPTSEDADPDPTTQIPWPGTRSIRRQRRTDQEAGSSRLAPANESIDPSTYLGGGSAPGDDEPGKRRLTTLDLFNLSVSMAGSQVAWTAELGSVKSHLCVPMLTIRPQIWNSILTLPGSF